ncbi:hypothetical protein TWF694_011556 [Orbilia ellipsospora]|uniref:Uncharacterized protein n=1 Tax=Orbilia ellipsospora TaxID=2528407 RepID=A0AAV9X6N8_9PEZI
MRVDPITPASLLLGAYLASTGVRSDTYVINLDTFYARHTTLVNTLAQNFFGLVHGALRAIPIGLNGPPLPSPDMTNQRKTLVQIIDAVQNRLYTLDRDLHHPYFINDPPENAKYGLYYTEEEDFLEVDEEPYIIPRETTVEAAIVWVKGFQDAIWGIYKWSTIAPPGFFKRERDANMIPEEANTWKTVQAAAEYLNSLALQDNIDNIRENPMWVLQYVFSIKAQSGSGTVTFDDGQVMVLATGFEALGQSLGKEMLVHKMRAKGREIFDPTVWWQEFSEGDYNDIHLMQKLYGERLREIAKDVGAILAAAKAGVNGG